MNIGTIVDPLDRLGALLASGTSEACDLAYRAHAEGGSASVPVDLPDGPWAGRAVLVDAGPDVITAHVSPRGGRMTLRALRHGKAWLLNPPDACVRVLERGVPVSDQDAPRAGWCWPGPISNGDVDLGDLRVVDMPSPEAIEAMLADPSAPLDPDLCHAIRVATWRMAIDHLLRDAPTDRVDLARTVLPSGGTAEVDDLVALSACMSLPNPSWVAAAARRHPALLDLFARPMSTGGGPHPALASLGEGASPFSAARSAVMDALYLDGVGEAPPGIVVRDLAGVRDLQDLAGDTLRGAVAMLATFHRARPSHRALTPPETDAVMVLAGSHMSTAIGPGLDAVGCMLDRGVVRVLPPDLGDAVVSLGHSLRELRQARAGGVWDWTATAVGIAFAPTRTWASLDRIDREWHARADAHQDALDVVEDAARARLLGPEVAKGVFPHFMAGPRDVGGVGATPMLDRAAFRTEGRALSHCVATHADRARCGSVQCVSLRGPGGLASTAEFACDDRGARLVQHRGASNREPPLVHARAVATLLAGLVADAAAVERLAAAAAAARAVAVGEFPRFAMTGDERAALLAVHFRNVAPWLPPSVVALGVEAWLDDAFGPRPVPGRGPVRERVRSWLHGMARVLGAPAVPLP